MTPELSKELMQAVEDSHGVPVKVVNPATKDQYVLMRAEMYERLKRVLDFGELSEAEEKADLQAWGQRAGWEEPDASVFDDLR